MAETIQRKLNDSPAARWTALLLIASTMFFGYMFVDLMSPLQSMIEAQRGWTPDVFGMYGSSEFILNVFGFLILAGIILDKMGVRFTGQLSASLMFIGACLKYYAVSDSFAGSGIETWLGSWWTSFPASAKLASLGFMIFGCGMEMAGITVSKAIAKWFEGKEMALAMGLEMAIARVGVFAIFSISPWLADMAPATVVRPVAFCTVLLLIGLLTFVIFSFMDRKLDKQLGLDSRGGGGSEEEFKVSDLKYILSSKVFWIIAFLCVLYYSAIFPFQKYAVNMLQCNLTLVPPEEGSFWASDLCTYIQYVIMLVVAAGAFAFAFTKNKSVKIPGLIVAIIALVVYCVMGYMRQSAAAIFAVFPLLAVGITPVLGSYVDHKGKAASMLVYGALLLILCHLTFAFILPMFKGNDVGGVAVAFLTILVLGASFSLVPASLWPSVPKLVDSKIIGSAYALIFWIQNIGLWLFPLLIGKVLTNTNPELAQKVAEGAMTEAEASVSYDYTWPLVMLACLGVAALFIGLYLKVVDRKKKLGLELPSIAADKTEVDESEVVAEDL